MSADTEIELLEKMACGDKKAFESLYNGYRGLSYAFVLSLVKDAAVAKDIVQDTFVKVWLKRAIAGRTVNFRAYLYKILRNAVMDWFDSCEIYRRYVANQILTKEEYMEYTEQKINADELYLLKPPCLPNSM